MNIYQHDFDKIEFEYYLNRALFDNIKKKQSN